uniref:Uncharacterized protein LOC100186859 n=1 Tax=Phallusia mammillata TaxID=59560 RepID=A0A6F9DIK1_9ASCI|nr:uncharacterized protein LOC100186859 [Phallusia mammillata]
MLRLTSVFLIFVFFVCSPTPSSGFFESLLNRVQKNLMTRWEQLRDQQTRPRLLAQLHLDGSPTFVETVENVGNMDLAVCSFNKTGKKVSLLRMQHVAEWLKGEDNFTTEVMASAMGWPNAVGRIENDILVDSQQDYWWMTTTYYAPERSGGSITFLPLPSNESDLIGHVRVTKQGKSGHAKNWYYSMIDWVDMDQDGWPDIVTTRSRVMPGSVKVSELIWLQNPGLSSLWTSRRSWTAHPITHGPDVTFRVLRIPLPSGESRLVIIGAGYWDNKLYAVWTDDPEEDWSNVEAVNERVIDNHGWFYDLQIADVNADGRDDVIVSTWVHGLQQGSVIVYEIPCDFIHGKWRRHTLIDGAVDMPLPDLGSGGRIKVFHPVALHSAVSRKKKPFIIVSGDNDGRVYVLIPSSRKTNDWEYISHDIYRARGPVGALAIDDLNHDGFMEIVIPVMDSNKLMFFTYEPGPIGPEYFVDERTP